MSRARDLANLADEATVLATDSEVSAAVAAIDLTNVQRIVPVDSNISVPGAPTSVSATQDNAQSAVSFVAPTSNGGSTILSYTVISSPGNIKKSGTTSPITITGLTNGTAYTFTVKAHNIAGSSVASSASSSVTPVENITVNYLVIAGGGSGGGGMTSYSGGGGGAGGYRTSFGTSGGGASAESTITAERSTNYTVTVGAGATGGTGSDSGTGGAAGPGFQGSNSVFSTITSTGGGRGGAGGENTVGEGEGGNGGSGGGAGASQTDVRGGGTGVTGQGYAGGSGSNSSFVDGGGGGGAGSVGTNASTTASSNPVAGGNGVASSITGTSITRAAGGDGNDGNEIGTATAGGANTGTGGGGGFKASNGANGGSGVVILRYLTAAGTITIGAGLTGTTETDGSYKVTTLTAGTGNVSWA